MAVQDKYVNTDANGTDHPYPSANVSGAKVFAIATTFEVAAADDDGSIYRLFKSLPATLIPIQVWINNDAVTAGSDYDLGFYKPESGVVIDKDSLADAADMSSAHVMGSELNGLTALGAEYVGKNISEILNTKLSNTTKYESVDVCLTANTVGTAAGTISVRALFAQG